MNREELFSKLRRNTPKEVYPMPEIKVSGISYDDTMEQFKRMSQSVGSVVVEKREGESLDDIIRSQYPEAKTFASNLPEITIAQKNPDTVSEASELNGTDVGIVRGTVGVAENGCIWIPQTMKERAVCFISEYLAIVLPSDAVVNNMHEAYRRIEMTGYGYGCFMSGPSKTADIEQALVMGAQAARGVLVVLV